jgi:hypothetical protein
LVSDIPAGDGKNDNLFSQCIFSESCAPSLSETFFAGIILTLFNSGDAAVLQVELPHFDKPFLLVSYSPCSIVVMLQFWRFSSLTGLNLSGEKTSWFRILKKTVDNV